MATFICFHGGTFESAGARQDLCQNRGPTEDRLWFEIVPYQSQKTRVCATTGMAHCRGIKCIKENLILHWGCLGGYLCHFPMAQSYEKCKKWPKRPYRFCRTVTVTRNNLRFKKEGCQMKARRICDSIYLSFFENIVFFHVCIRMFIWVQISTL